MVGLNDFTSIFQLLAALCILFFYDDLLKRVTPTSARENAINYVDVISTTLQGFDAHLARKLSRIANNAKIEHFNSVVSHVGKTFFIFLFAILIFAANDSLDRSSVNQELMQIERIQLHTYAFLLSMMIVFYSIIVMWCRQVHWCRRYWSFLYATIFIFIYTSVAVLNFLMPFQIPLFPVPYVVILSFITVAAWIIITFYYDERRAKMFENDLKIVSDQIQSFANWSIQPNSFKRFSEMDLELKWHINFTDTPEYAGEIVYPILRQRIKSILTRHALGYVAVAFKS